MAAASKVFGNSTPRLEDPALLQGKATFVDDIHLPGMLECAFVRSPHAHASIGAIDKAAALAVPGVVAVLTAADLAPHLVIDRLVVGLPSPAYRLGHVDRPILAKDETVHVGEPIAMVVASSRYIAEDAAALVAIDFTPLDAVADCRLALQDGAVKAHKDKPHNLAAEFDMAFGDVDAAFAMASHVLREQFWCHRGGGHSMECRGVVASYDALNDLITVWSSTQTPHAEKQLIRSMLGLEEDQIRVVTPDVGGGFGPKLVNYQEDIVAALAARLLGRPIKWIEDRREHFVSTTQERDQYWDAEMAIDAEGRVLGIRTSILHDHGAYTARGVNIPYGSATAVTLAYQVPSYSVAIKLAVTNKVPVTPVRGAGQPQGVFVMERLLDRAAQLLKMDRAEIRRRNLVPPSKMPYATPLQTRGGGYVILDSGDFPKCQQDALSMANWESFPARQKEALDQGRYIGIGLANYVEGTGRGPFEPVSVRIAQTGKVHIASGAAAMGQSTKTMLAQVVMEHLGGDMDNARVSTGDTAAIDLGMGGFNSRQAVMAGASAHAAALKVREKVLRVAALLLKSGNQELDIVGNQVQVAGEPTRAITLAQLAQTMGGMPGYKLPGNEKPGLEALEHVIIDDMTFANGSAVVEVEVDPETGKVTITNFILSHDCGRMINPMIVAGQMHGGVAHGISNTLFEWMGFDDTAQPVTTNYGEYLLVSAPEMPHIHLCHTDSPTPLNAMGIKGVGESGVIPTPAAIISAIEDALSPFNVRLSQAPLFPHEIVAAVHRARAGTT